MATYVKCDPCGKTFTGRVCYDQHMKSDKHRRKVLSLGLINSGSLAYVEPSSTLSQIPQLSNAIECSVCNVAFNSFEDFQTHSLSPEHARKVMEKNSSIDHAYNVVTSSSSSLNFKAGSTNENVSVDENDKILPTIDMCRSQTLLFSSCLYCNKIFSGPEPYKQHMESVAHKKKVELATTAPATKSNQSLMTFSCDPCKKIFSGQVPYVQHMNSEVHKKKVLSLQFLEKSLSEVDSPSETTVPNGEENLKEKNRNLPWFCNDCEKQCSGYIPYKQHLEGIIHLKNIAKAEREKFSSKPEDNSRFILQQCKNEEKYILNASHLESYTDLQLSKDNQNSQVDCILPGLVNNLHEVSTEELEASIKIYLPDDEIDFDKLGRNTDSAEVSKEIEGECNEKVRNDPGYNENDVCYSIETMEVDEIKKKSDLYEKCDLCNVKLLNKEEAENHYESLEHFSRKWKSN